MQNSIQNFFKTFRNEIDMKDEAENLFDNFTLDILSHYSRVISSSKKDLKLTDNETVVMSMVLGFLLKRHIDEHKLNKIFESF